MASPVHPRPLDSSPNGTHGEGHAAGQVRPVPGGLPALDHIARDHSARAPSGSGPAGSGMRLRPLPPESALDRARRKLAEWSMRGATSGAPRRSGSGDAHGDHDDSRVGLSDLGERLLGGRQRLDDHHDQSANDEGRGTSRFAGHLRLVPLAVVVVLGAGGWWLLKPPAPPLEVSIPAAESGAPAATAAAGGSSPPVNEGAVAVDGDPAGLAAVPGDAAVGADGQAPAGSTAAPEVLVVHASGAVASPGVYRLPTGARVDDLIRAAGGVAPDGDADRVNLAAPLIDGERVWVPRRGETEVPDVVAGGSTGGGGSAAGSPTAGGTGTSSTAAPKIVDLNSATAEELDSLPGVGPATATAILAYRDQNGPFLSVDDLLEVRGIGEAKLEQIRPLVRT